MDNELIYKDTRESFTEIENLRTDLLSFAELAKQDPALTNMGVSYAFTDDLKAFESRSKASVAKLQRLSKEISSNRPSCAYAAQYAKLAKDINTDLEWLHAIQAHLKLMILSSSQDLPQWFMAEITRYLESVFAKIKEIMALIIDQYWSRLVRDSRTLWAYVSMELTNQENSQRQIKLNWAH